LSYFTILSNKRSISAFMILIFAMTAFQFIDPVLSVQLISLGMREDNTGIGFSVIGFATVVGSPIAGLLSQKFKIRNVTQTGIFIMAGALFLVGPSLFMGWLTPSIWLMFIGLFFQGFGASLMYIPTAPEIMNANTEIEREKLYMKFSSEGDTGEELDKLVDYHYDKINGILADKASAL